MTIQVRSIDLTVAPSDVGSIADRAESISTVAGGGSVSVVSNVGLRMSVGAASGDSVLVQTPERHGGTARHIAQATLLFTGQQLGRQLEVGFIDGVVGAFFRINDGVVRLVVQRNDTDDELLTVVSSEFSIDMVRVHTWAVHINERREAEFFVDGVSLGAIQATKAVMAQRINMRAGIRVTVPIAAVGTAAVDVHWWSIDAAQLMPPRRVGNATSAAQNTLIIKDEGGFLHDLHVLVDTASVRYIMLFDLATAPTGGETPVLRLHIKASSVGVDLRIDEPFAMRFAKGITAAVSTTIGTLTLPSGDEGYFDSGRS